MCFVYFDSARVWWTDEWTELTAHASLCNLASFGCLQIRDFQKEIHTLQPEMIREYIDTCHSSLATVLCTGNTPCAWHRLYPVLMTVGADESFSRDARAEYSVHCCFVCSGFWRCISMWRKNACNVCCRADVLSMTTVDFMTKEDAVQYCERNGTPIFTWYLVLLINSFILILVISKDN